ncbi:immunomodulatory protein [Epithele typhae]|uniref:immunomodulatory protein n=1 Tax=Epithele typhae TaxID=378194 RepID=UPI0020081CBC|nr:immunomodulatory protein [Epithele typhae]KAH9911674.1 immunomodulatory protein [Epithele typhae]
MQFKIASLALLAAFLAPTALAHPGARTDTVPVTYDNTYDNPRGSLNSVACSNGVNGLVTKGYTIFASLPNYPYIGGGFPVPGWNSTECGSCWTIYYEGKNINVTLVDTAGRGFNIAEKALNVLTNGRAAQLGRIDATFARAPAEACA